jgi:hypothetical protein
LPHLRHLDFYCGFGITDKGLAYLREAPQLESLQFGSPGEVSEAGLANLRYLSHLRRLNLKGFEMSDEIMLHLAGLQELEDLSLGPGVTDRGLECLRGMQKLRKLDLTATKVTEVGIDRLAETLPDCLIHCRPPKQEPATEGDPGK